MPGPNPSANDDIGKRLIFLIGAPRSGTTLLQRMLDSHPKIRSFGEPNVLTPLFYYLHRSSSDKGTETQPIDLRNAQGGFKEFCDELPDKKETQIEAVRAYANTLYQKILPDPASAYFLDKTPVYALFTDFIEALYPDAKFIVLTRHPLAIWRSWVHMHFGGNYRSALKFQPTLKYYVPAIADFLKRRGHKCIHIRYEALVKNPRHQVESVLRYLGISPDSASVNRIVNYGDTHHVVKQFGDLRTINHQNKPTTNSISAWTQDLDVPMNLAVAQEVVSTLKSNDLHTWGFSRDDLWEPLGGPQTRVPIDASRKHSHARRSAHVVRVIVNRVSPIRSVVKLIHRITGHLLASYCCVTEIGTQILAI